MADRGYNAGNPFNVKSLPGFAAMAVICFVLLYLPIVMLVIYAFNSGDSIAIWEGFSLRWFQTALANRAVQDASVRSLVIAVMAATIATLVATMAALATTRTAPYPGLTFKYAVINQPLMVPEIVTAVALLIVFSRIKVFTGYSGLGYLIAAHSAFCVPFAYLPIKARLESMDSSLERAAADLYARPWQAFRWITLPLLLPGIVAGFMLAFVISLDDVVITEFVKSAGQETLPTYMLGQLRREVSPEINAIATGFMALSVALVSAFYFINRQKK
jgi:spermidine/putrescine transport system permease protein